MLRRPPVPRRPLAENLTSLVATSAIAGYAWLSARGTVLPLRQFTYVFTAAIVALVASPVILVVVLPAMFGIRRVAAAGVDISVADVAIVLGAVAAIPCLSGVRDRLKQLLLVAGAYQAILAIVVVANPTRAAMFEWAHRIALVGGAVAVGAALAHTQLLPLAVRLYLGLAALFALDAVYISLSSGFEHAYPFGMQKNPAGLLIAFGLLTLFVMPTLSRIPVALQPVLGATLLAGLLATRSRGSMIAILLASLVWAFRSGRVKRTVPVAIMAAAALVFVVVITTESELEEVRTDPDAARFKGIGSRVEQTERSLEIWRETPVVGAGLRYFRDPALRAPEPHNVLVQTLGEGGLVGALGFGALQLGAVWVLWELRSPMARLAKLAILMRLTAGVLDIYWVGGTGSVPWILAGVAVATTSPDRSRELTTTA